MWEEIVPNSSSEEGLKEGGDERGETQLEGEISNTLGTFLGLYLVWITLWLDDRILTLLSYAKHTLSSRPTSKMSGSEMPECVRKQLRPFSATTAAANGRQSMYVIPRHPKPVLALRQLWLSAAMVLIR